MKKTLLLGAGLTAFATLTHAAVLTSVSMQGSMVHVGFSYNAAASELHVHVDAGTPQLTPLDISHPGDSFDPADPWHPSLDPSQQALAFNRQYGFVMDGASDPLPANAGVWIRLLSSTPGLEAYTYRATPPTWTPMFGTAGSTNLLEWNLFMFHPAFVAPPVNGSHSASFEAFVVDLGTGEPVSGIAPALFTLNWTSVEGTRPTLSIANAVVLSWSTNASGYALESSDSGLSGTWSPVTNAPVLLEGRNAVVLPPSAAVQMFRLTQTP